LEFNTLKLYNRFVATFSKYRVPFFFLVIIFVISGTFLTILFARGYRFDYTNKKIKPTGLLVAASVPIGAQVYVNGKLETATNNTLNLEPGTYNIRIQKESYIPWEKKLLIEKELVSQADVLLFLKLPDIRPITFTGISNPQACTDSSKILFLVPLSASNTKNATSSAILKQDAGVWVIDLNDYPLGLGRPPRQIAKSLINFDFSKAVLIWSPDCREILADFSPSAKYLLPADQLNQINNLVNISSDYPALLALWQKEIQTKFESKFKKVPEKLQPILLSSAVNITFSPDSTKVLYVATASAQIPDLLIPLVPASSSQKENRNIEAQKVYVYDLKEDKNFEISNFQIPISKPTPTPKKTKSTTKVNKSDQLLTLNFELLTPKWFPSSRHLIWIKDNKIVICEFDNTNFAEIYSGSFIKPFLFTTGGNNKVVVVTQIDASTKQQPDLFEVNLR